MRAGQAVTFIDPDGGEHPARVHAVVGTGASFFKVLDLVIGEGAVALTVPHEKDGEPGRSAWREGEPAMVVHPKPHRKTGRKKK